MPGSVIRREVVPALAVFAALVGAALFSDILLHRLDLVRIGRYLGIPGMLLILGAMVYSLRKRKVITAGNPGKLLRLHEFMAWFGSMLVLVHAGVHFNAILPWLAVAFMLVNVISGLTGQFLLQRARRRLVATRASLQQSGKTVDEVADAVYWDAVVVDAMMKWRSVHFPIAFLFAFLAASHIAGIALFWNWR